MLRWWRRRLRFLQEVKQGALVLKARARAFSLKAPR